MRKLYEIFKVLKVQKTIVSAETIPGNTVAIYVDLGLNYLTPQNLYVLQSNAV